MITFKIYTSYEELPKTWNATVNHDTLLQTSYLQALEEASPSNITLYYVGVFKEDILVGVALIQRVELYLKDIFRRNSSSKIKQFFKNSISKVLRGNILVVGNLTHTGQHGLFFNEDQFTPTVYLDTLFNAINELKAFIKQKKKKKIRAIMLKDYFENDIINQQTQFIKSHQLYKLNVQPNMIMNIKSDWIKNEDYIADLQKKYKTRYKRAKKKLNGIECRELDTEAIKTKSKVLYRFYKNVSNNAKLNTFILPENHFYSLKVHLKNNFKVYGYYLDDELIGFYTLILNSTILETYFLGYDKEHQYPNQLYLNMLYDMIGFAIENKFTSIVYARTAMEIKSSVGAKPKEMVMYMKHTNSVANSILKLVFNFMKPAQKWNERHPFKELHYSTNIAESHKLSLIKKEF